MTPSGSTAAGPRTRALLESAEGLDAALRRAGDRVPAGARDAARAALTAVRERLELGVDHTVVALVGGTGSGKSSLFNALSGLRFADVGARRPTTSAVTACTWGDASGLLDWLEVEPERRIERESALDGDTQADLRGLVLLDLPDHDSVAEEHRAVVDRLLPMVDLLVWVVDPQKYADDALHTGYLRHLVGHERSMLVVLNQVDTVPVTEQAGLLRDVARLLREDGLDAVPVHAVSARTGDGVPVLREAIARAVEGRGQAERRARAEIGDAARALAPTVATSEPKNLPRDATVEELVRAVGADSSAQAVRNGGEPELVPPRPERVAEVRRGWLAQVAGALPEPWRASVERGLADDDALTARVAEALDRVERPSLDQRRPRRLRTVAGVLALVALVVVAAGVGTAVGSGGATTTVVLLGVAAVLAAATAVAAAVLARRAAVRSRERRAAALLTEVRSALGSVVDEGLATPTRAVLADHRALRRAVASDEDESPRARHAASTDPVADQPSPA
ncbi:YfjP family GTPase [Actinotalea sp. AC32]|nr:YfjP family GTPase [Actinotalea sp. AC32]